MGNFLKTFLSLFIALIVLLGIFFLPENNLGKITNFLKFISRSDNTAFAFGYYLLNKVITGVSVFLIIFVFFRAGKSLYKKYGPDRNRETELQRDKVAETERGKN